MTWIVGGVTPVGQAFIVGDTRVTFGDKREADLVRKVHWIGRDMVAGFSGSVRIGFHLLTDLAMKLRLDDRPEVIWKPEAVTKRWSREAAEIFSGFDEREQEAGCSILIAAVAPRNNGPFPFATLIRMSSPTFRPHIMPRFGSMQIGSGRQHKIYRDWAEQYFSTPQFMVNFANWEGTIASVFALSLSDQVRKNPVPCVSPFMHVVACGRGTRTEARVPVPAFDGDPSALAFPEVAGGYTTFLNLAQDLGFEASAARA
jgi:hypothetical protein